MTEEVGVVLSSALLLGFVGSGHCLGMCGGIAAALGQVNAPEAGRSPLVASLLYSLGRITSYATFGALAGQLGGTINSIVGLGPTFRVLAGILIIGFGIHTVGWHIGIDRIEKAGLAVWRRISPLIGRVGPPDRIWKLFTLGALWGWLPCGLVYSALAAAAVTGSAATGAGFMFCFGLGTMPALVVATGAAGRFGIALRKRAARWAVGALLVSLGIWTIVTGLSTARDVHQPGLHAPPHHVMRADLNP